MPIPDKITPISKKSDNTVYFYPKSIKISYFSLDKLHEYLSTIISSNEPLEKNYKTSGIFLDKILTELYMLGVAKEDHTMVIHDTVVENDIFFKSLASAYEKTRNTNILFFKLTKLQMIKRQLLVAIFMKKLNPVQDFINLTRGKGTFNSRIIRYKVNLSRHSKIKFRPTNELEEYIVNIITRKALLAQGSSVITLHMYIPVIIELVVWYARALSLLENKHEVDHSLLSSAIKLVDSHYITNPKFIKMLQSRFMGYLIKTFG